MKIALMMEAARPSETLVNFYQTTRCYNPEDSNLQNRPCPNFYNWYLHTHVPDVCSHRRTLLFGKIWKNVKWEKML
jgi:hypothetical protein